MRRGLLTRISVLWAAAHSSAANRAQLVDCCREFFFWLSFHSAWQSEIKTRASFELSFRPDATAMAVNDPLNGRQSYAGPFEFGHAMKPLKGSKQSACERHVETGPIVAYEIR